MATYEHQSRVRAPLETVWEFHSTIEGLVALTPGFMRLRVESVHGPDGTPDPDVLETGSAIHLSVRPFGVGPRQDWTSVVTAREEENGAARFRDRMYDGPFARWRHTHSFYADGDETVLHDRVEYDLPGGSLGRRAGPLAVVGFEPMFRYRHRETRRRLEDRARR